MYIIETCGLTKLLEPISTIKG